MIETTFNELKFNFPLIEENNHRILVAKLKFL